MPGNAENMKFSISNLSEYYIKLGLSERDIAARKTVNLRPASLQTVLEWIDTLGLEPGVSSDFKKAAGRYPHQALGRFVEKHESILFAIMQARRELNKANSFKDDDGTKETKKEGDASHVPDEGSHHPQEGSGGHAE